MVGRGRKQRVDVKIMGCNSRLVVVVAAGKFVCVFVFGFGHR